MNTEVPSFTSGSHDELVRKFTKSLSARSRNILADNLMTCPFALARIMSVEGKGALVKRFRNCGKKSELEIRNAVCLFMRDFTIRQRW